VNDIIAGSIFILSTAEQMLRTASASAKNTGHDRISCFGCFVQDIAFSNVNT